MLQLTFYHASSRDFRGKKHPKLSLKCAKTAEGLFLLRCWRAGRRVKPTDAFDEGRLNPPHGHSLMKGGIVLTHGKERRVSHSIQLYNSYGSAGLHVVFASFLLPLARAIS